jgi:hypothetical protein
VRTQTSKTHASRKKLRRKSPVTRTQPFSPVWEKVLRIAGTIPEADLHKLPTDLTAQHDHYVYDNE